MDKLFRLHKLLEFQLKRRKYEIEWIDSDPADINYHRFEYISKFKFTLDTYHIVRKIENNCNADEKNPDVYFSFCNDRDLP